MSSVYSAVREEEEEGPKLGVGFTVTYWTICYPSQALESSVKNKKQTKKTPFLDGPGALTLTLIINSQNYLFFLV